MSAIVFYYLLAINIVTFFIYGIDKWKAIHNRWRISEASLIGLAVIGGSVGALGGMLIFHHKVRKPKFYVGVPIILAVQLVVYLCVILM